MVPFHEFLDLSFEDREGKTPYIVTVERDKTLSRLTVSAEIVTLAAERQQLWSQLRELAGVLPSESLRERLTADIEAKYEVQLAAVRAEYEAKIAELPKTIAKKMADALLRGAGKSVMEKVASTNGRPPEPMPSAPPKPDVQTERPSTAVASPASLARNESVATAVAESDDLTIDPSIDSERCTTCNECINLNSKLFAYNGDKQATIKDAAAGTFAQLVTAAERCPVSAIHPGTPRNPKEKDLAKWLKRAEPFS
jgi:pyruvate-ferredoxin/flavodoxin oxidoreductase